MRAFDLKGYEPNLHMSCSFSKIHLVFKAKTFVNLFNLCQFICGNFCSQDNISPIKVMNIHFKLYDNVIINIILQ